jgi:dipeptidyl aminopeptidase/acylaminoacyl peptidase
MKKILTCLTVLALAQLAGLPATAAANPAQPAQPAPIGSPNAPRALAPDDIYSLKNVGDPRVSPDGLYVAYTVRAFDRKEDRSDSDIYMVPLAGGEPLRLTGSPKPENHPRFSPDGRYLAFLSSREGKKSQVWLLPRVGGEAFQLTRFQADVHDLAWSPDGKRLALVVEDVDPDDPDVAPPTPAPAAPAAEAKDRKEEPAKTPKPIVITRRQFKRDTEGYLRDVRNHLYVFDLATQASEQITSGPYDDDHPAWSPDGREIAFSSNRTADPDANQNSDIFLVAARPGQAPRALTTSPAAEDEPAFSPDGKEIAYVMGGDPADMWYGPSSIAVVPAAGGPARSLTKELDRNVRSPRFSPDGRSILFLIEEGGNSHLARVPAAGGKVVRVIDGERDLQSFDLGPKGEIAVLASEPHLPDEVFTVAGGSDGSSATLTRITHTNDAFLAGIRLGKVERFRARSADGTPVDTFLTLPPDVSGITAGKDAKRLPTILRIHGGPASQFTTGFNFEWQVLAAHGFAVVAANPRGSTGYGRDFSRAIWADWGNKDYQDVMAAVDQAIAMGVADPDRLGVGGWSYGGILTDYVLVKTGRFKAATSGASEANYFANYGTDQYQYEWETELGLPWKNTELWMHLSPWFQVEKVTTPTLLLCGADDMNVPLLNSEQLYQALRRLGRDTELVIYPGQHHGINKPSYVKDRYERYLAWYDKYLRREATAQARGR